MNSRLETLMSFIFLLTSGGGELHGNCSKYENGMVKKCGTFLAKSNTSFPAPPPIATTLSSRPLEVPQSRGASFLCKCTNILVTRAFYTFRFKCLKALFFFNFVPCPCKVIVCTFYPLNRQVGKPGRDLNHGHHDIYHDNTHQIRIQQ